MLLELILIVKIYSKYERSSNLISSFILEIIISQAETQPRFPNFMFTNTWVLYQIIHYIDLIYHLDERTQQLIWEW